MARRMTAAARRKTRPKTKAAAEFGDFQTPPALAAAAVATLRRLGVSPRAILEPTCGRGAFVKAAAVAFPEAARIVGVDINGAILMRRGTRSATKLN